MSEPAQQKITMKCDVCNIEVLKKSYKRHCSSEKHKNNADIVKNLEKELAPPPPVQEMDIPKKMKKEIKEVKKDPVARKNLRELLADKLAADPLTLVNYYQIMDDANKPVPRHYELEDKMQITVPFRMMEVGSSGKMKTNIIPNLIRMFGIFNHFIICAKKLDEPLYVELIEKFKGIEKKNKTRIYIATDDMAMVPKVSDFNVEDNTLVIIDDMINEADKNFQNIKEIYTRGRKNGISSIFITHSYFKTPMIIRQNTDYILMKKLNSMKDAKRVLREYETGELDDKELLKLYNKAVNSAPEAFFMIDIETFDPNLRFRHNFKGFKISEEN